MRSITEHQEALNEALQSTNEELLSSSEKLQSLNEELKTGKEKLQSSNEELMLVNQEVIGLNEQVTESKNYAETIFATLREPLLILDKNLRIKSANKSFYNTFQVSEVETEGKLIYHLGNNQWNIPELRMLLESVLPNKQSLSDFEISFNFPHLGERIMQLNASKIMNEKGTHQLILISFGDITERRIIEKKIVTNEERFRNLLLQSPFCIALCKGENMVIDLANDAMKELWGKGRKVEGKSVFSLLDKISTAEYKKKLLNVYHTGRPYFGIEQLVVLERNETFTDCYFNFTYQPYHEAHGAISGIVCVAYEVTQQVLAKRKVEASEQRFQAAVQAVQGILWTNNGKGEMEGEQLGWALLTGQTYEQYQGYGWAQMVHPDDAKPTVDAWNDAVRGRKTFIFEHRLKTKNGEWRDFSIRAIPLFYADGTLLQWVGVHTDITDKKQAAKALKANEEKLNIVIEASELGTWELNLKTKEVTYSKKYLEILGGYKEDIKLTLAQLLQHLHPDDIPVREKAFEEAIITGYLHYEARLKWKDKSTHWMEAKGKVFFDEENKPENLIGTIRDITKERNHQKELEESEERFRNVANSAPVLIWMAGTDKLYYFFNKGWLNFTGRTMVQEKGNGWTEGVHPDDLQKCLGTYLSSFDKREPFYTEYRLKRHDGKYRWLSNNGVPRFTSDGMFEGYIGACMDINEQKIAEEQFKALADQAPMWVWLTDKEVNVLYANPELLKFIGISNYTEFTGNIWEQKVHPEDIGLVYSSFAQAVSLQQPFSFEFRVLNAATQQYEWFYIKAVPRLESGECTGFIGTGININAQRLILSQLEYRKALLEAHNESSLDGILLVDTKGKILSCNHRFAEIWNMQQEIVDDKDDEAALAFAVTQLVKPNQFMERVRWMYENPKEISIDELEFKDGKIIERHGYHVAGADGSYYGCSWMFRDITEQKKYERAVKESEEKFRLLADSMPQHIWTSDPEGNLNYYNQSVFNYSGLTLEQINKDGWIQIVHPNDREENIKQWTEAITNSTNFLFEHRFKKYDGEYRWQLSRAVPQKDANGNITMWVGSSTDIQAIKEEEQRKGAFIKMVSYELKTPVTSIKGYVQLLLSMLKEEKELQLSAIPLFLHLSASTNKL